MPFAIGDYGYFKTRRTTPIVVASQLPLTFSGSEIMTRMFYARWMEGN